MFSGEGMDPFAVDANSIQDFDMPSTSGQAQQATEQGQAQALGNVSSEMASTFTPEAIGDVFSTASQAVGAGQQAATAPLTQQLQSLQAAKAQGHQQFAQQWQAAQRPILPTRGLGNIGKWVLYGVGALAIGGAAYYFLRKKKRR